MKEEKNFVPSFDELKDERFSYHYSRAERIAKTRKKQQENPAPAKKLDRFFGNNKMVKTFVIFYIAIGIIVWGYIYLSQISENKALYKSLSFSKGKKINVRLLTNQQKYGLNLLINNTEKNEWKINKIKLPLLGFETNVSLTIESGEVRAMFISIPSSISNIKNLLIEIE